MADGARRSALEKYFGFILQKGVPLMLVPIAG